MTQLEYKKPILRRARRVVVKIGSQILSSKEGIEEGRFKGLVRDLAALHERKKEIVVVSSGAVAAPWRNSGYIGSPSSRFAMPMNGTFTSRRPSTYVSGLVR